jgi:hypothetical protein
MDLEDKTDRPLEEPIRSVLHWRSVWFFRTCIIRWLDAFLPPITARKHPTDITDLKHDTDRQKRNDRPSCIDGRPGRGLWRRMLRRGGRVCH